MKIQVEYIWLDGQAEKPQAGNRDKMAELRSKTKILEFEDEFQLSATLEAQMFPEWGFDGSSTEQAEGRDSDCKLKPVFACHDPIRGYPNILVLCEVMNPDGTPHASDTRHKLAEVAEKFASEGALFGIEQEYTLMSLGGRVPYAWAVLREAWRSLGCLTKWLAGEPEAQGRYYCGVGADRAFGRLLVERHTQACIDAGLSIAGTNLEVMPGQAEYQIGPLPPLAAADQLWIARYLMHRLGEDYGIVVSLHPKPMGKDKDWNGAGAHTNFSTDRMMGKVQGVDPWEAITKACNQLGLAREAHIKVYGAGNEERLTGQHETCSIHQFRYGVSDRGASIRIPMSTANNKKGYAEDRRPAANMDPYLVIRAILETVCGQGFKE